MASNETLNGVTIEQLREALAVIRQSQGLPPGPTTTSLPRNYFYIVCGDFETYVTWVDAKDEAQALKIAQSSLQPWYVRSCSHITDTGRLGMFDVIVEPKTHHDYVAWLRRA